MPASFMAYTSPIIYWVTSSKFAQLYLQNAVYPLFTTSDPTDIISYLDYGNSYLISLLVFTLAPLLLTFPPAARVIFTKHKAGRNCSFIPLPTHLPCLHETSPLLFSTLFLAQPTEDTVLCHLAHTCQAHGPPGFHTAHFLCLQVPFSQIHAYLLLTSFRSLIKSHLVNRALTAVCYTSVLLPPLLSLRPLSL